MRSFLISALFLFAFAKTFSQAPGGVTSHLVLWARADAGSSTTDDNTAVDNWADQSPGAITLIGNNYPLYQRNACNYNPGMLFGPSVYFDAGSVAAVSNSTLFVAGVPAASSSIDTFRIPWTSDYGTQHPLAVANSSLGHYQYTGITSTGSNTDLHWNDGELSFARSHVYSSGDVAVSKAGSSSVLMSGVSDGLGSYYFLGSDPNVSNEDGSSFGEGFGTIAETIIYDDASLSGDDIAKIESYLALKYGVTKDNSGGGSAGDYILSNGSLAWDADLESSFHHDIASLVRDDASLLLQKQAHSTDDKLRVFTGALASDNVSNTGNLTNDVSSLVIGNNGGILKRDLTATKPTGIVYRFGRCWKITNNNFADNFSLEIKWDSVGNFNLADIRLLVSTTPDFSAADVYDDSKVTFALGSIIIGNISTSIVPMNSTVYVTIGSATTYTSLPVEIVSFTATATQNDKVALNWQTSAEVNNRYFTVERSASGASWETLTTVNGASNAAALNNYNAVDANPYPGLSYYRIKQTDLDGNFKYSIIRAVKIARVQDNSQPIYPNPVNDKLNFKGTAAAVKSIRIVNLSGQDMGSLVTIHKTSNFTAVLDCSGLSRGVYLLMTSAGTTQFIKR